MRHFLPITRDVPHLSNDQEKKKKEKKKQNNCYKPKNIPGRNMLDGRTKPTDRPTDRCDGVYRRVSVDPGRNIGHGRSNRPTDRPMRWSVEARIRNKKIWTLKKKTHGAVLRHHHLTTASFKASCYKTYYKIVL